MLLHVHCTVYTYSHIILSILHFPCLKNFHFNNDSYKFTGKKFYKNVHNKNRHVKLARKIQVKKKAQCSKRDINRYLFVLVIFQCFFFFFCCFTSVFGYYYHFLRIENAADIL